MSFYDRRNMSKNTNSQSLLLNFFPLHPETFLFQVYRKRFDNSQQDTKKDPLVKICNLPESSEVAGSSYQKYAVRLDPFEGYESFLVPSDANVYLTKWFLLLTLHQRAKQLGLEINSRDDKIYRSLEIVTNQSTIGKEVISICPYYLRNRQKAGFLILYRFRKNDDHPFGIDVQKKSLSLDSSGRSNSNFYIDHFNKIKSFLSAEKYKCLFSISIKATRDTDAETSIGRQQQIDYKILSPKRFTFGGGQPGTSPFWGVKKHGPFEQLATPGRLVFLFREQDRTFSQDIYRALSGSTYEHTFSGMEKMFGFPVTKETVSGFAINDFKYDTVQEAIRDHCVRTDDIPVVPIVIVPWSRMDPHGEGGCDYYYRLKHQFLQKRIPCQFVSTKQILKRDQLKWSISNIGLAIFAKLGGKPWKLIPQTDRCLIIGIGQSQFTNTSSNYIKKYYAYSVLTDSSGLYDTIRVLANSDNESDYLNGLSGAIRDVIKEHEQSYDHFVLHSPFKIRREYMDRIRTTLDDISSQSGVGKVFSMLKFNEQDQYMVFSSSNSKVPLEGTCVALGGSQYLVWFEGAKIDKNISSAISKPTHIEFEYPIRGHTDISDASQRSHDSRMNYIQDAINLSGANWRGFNAKNKPVSVYYAEIISKYIENFDRLELDMIDIDGMSPWFL